MAFQYRVKSSHKSLTGFTFDLGSVMK